MSIETRLRETGPRGGGGGSGGAGTGTINPGSAGNLAFYPANGTTIDDCNVSVTTGPGLAALNFQALTSQIVSPNSGDFWVLNSAGMFLQYYWNGTAFYTRLTQTDGTVSSSSAGLAGTGVYYLGTSANSTWPNWYVIQPGSSMSAVVSGTNYILSMGSAGLQGTGGLTLTAGTNVTISTDATSIYVNAFTGAGTTSGGLAGTGMFYLMSTAQTSFPNSRQVLAGSSITVRTDATNFYIDAITNTYAGSAGLAGTGFYYIVGSSTPGLPSSKILTAGSSVTIVTDSTSFYINAITNAAGGVVYAPTGGFYAAWSADPLLTNEKVITAGSSMTITTDATSIYFTAITNTYPGSSGLLGTASFLVAWSADPLLSNEKVLTSGSSATIRTDSTAIYVDASTAGLAFQSTQINTNFPLSGGGDLSATRTLNANTSFLVTSNRLINTTSPAGGGGNLGGDLTITVGSLSSIGSANQISRTNSGGTSWEYVNLVGGSSITVSSVSGKIQIDASTGGAASNSGGLAGTGFYYVFHTSGTDLYPNSRLLTQGSSITIRTDATSVYIDAITSLGVSNVNIGTGGFLQFPVQSAKLYSNTSAARIDGGTGTWRLLYSATTQQYGVWQFQLPYDYSGSPAMQLIFSNDSSLAVAKSVQWLVDQWGYANSQSSIYIDTYAGANSTTIALSAGYSAGLIQIITVPLATTNSFNAGNLIKIRVSASNGAVTGNQELVGLNLFYRAGTQTIATGSAGLASTGACYLVWSDNGTLFNEGVFSAGTGITIDTSGANFIVSSIDKDYDYYVNMRTGHMLGAFASVNRPWYIGNCVNATALATAVIGINSAHMVPFAAVRNIKVDSMSCNVTIAGSVTTQIQLAIYTNSADECLFPYQCVSSSAFLTGSNLQLVAYNPAITLTANQLYWFGYLITKSAVTLRTVAVGGAFPILGVNSGMGTTPGLGYQIFLNPTNGFVATMPGSGNVTTAAFPALGIRGSI